jgi:hypothetical protein
MIFFCLDLFLHDVGVRLSDYFNVVVPVLNFLPPISTFLTSDQADKTVVLTHSLRIFRHIIFAQKVL